MNRRKFIKSAIAGLAATGLSGCGGGAKGPPSVVLILVDQLRKDTADKCLKSVMTKARDGFVFNQMRSAASWTYPSVLSLVSGLYPYQHGANGHATEKVLSTFSPEVPTLQKTFKAHGFSTAAFITNPFLMNWNSFHVGFDHFDAGFINGIGNAQGGGEVVFTTPRMFANTVNRAMIEHYESHPLDAPEYTYVHYIDAHGPWFNNPPFAADYDSAVRYLDERIMEIFAFFNARYDGHFLFAVTADHGMGFGRDFAVGEKKEMRITKKSMHDFNIRIPLIFMPSSALPAQGRVVDEICSNVDVPRTLLGLCGIEMPHPSPGLSLVPAFEGGKIAPEGRVIYSDVSAFGVKSDCVIVDMKKHIRYFDITTGAQTTSRIFDLVADPLETANMEDTEGAEKWFAMAKGSDYVFPSTFENLAAETRKDLEALGYLK